MCPSNGDEASVQDFLDTCIVSTEDALGGGVLPLDVIDCNAKIGTLKTGEIVGAQRGVAREFTDNGDGTITDNVTGLMWEKKSDDGSVHDKDNLYSWSTGADFGAMDGTMITAFLSTLNAGSGFAGYTDWRIPNRNELLSLTNLGAIAPSTFRPEFDDACMAGCTVSTCSCTNPGVYWSSSPRSEHLAWYVDFEYGFSVYFSKTNGASVRAVRGGA